MCATDAESGTEIARRDPRAKKMSRGLDVDREDERGLDLRKATPAVRAPSLPRLEPRDPHHRSLTVPASHFTLRSGRERSDVFSRRGHVRLRDTESQTLVTVGTFRVVFERDLVEGPTTATRRAWRRTSNRCALKGCCTGGQSPATRTATRWVC